MKLSRILPVRFLLLSVIMFLSIGSSNGFRSSSLSASSSSLTAITLLFSASGFPSTFSLPNRKVDLSPKIKNSGYYRWANNLLSWVFDKLEGSDEDDDDDKSGPGRKDIDSLEDSSEETADSRRKAAAKQKRLQSRNKGRLGDAGPTAKPNNGGGSDPDIEKASLPELKNMLTQLKREDKSIFSTQIITNPVASPLWSFGTGMFRKVFCGLRPQNNYCFQDDLISSSNFFAGFKRALTAFRSLY